MTHADQIIQWLEDLGYSHCFFVSGGNSMHLLNAARQKMTCIPVVHEVSGGIAAEYFNESGLSSGKAFVLVTAGPGLTNLVTALAGAFLESRELLVIGGQVKSSDLSTLGLRQRGIQEINGTAIVESISKNVFRVETPISQEQFCDLVSQSSAGRKGPVVIEVCLDAQGVPVTEVGQKVVKTPNSLTVNLPVDDGDIKMLSKMIQKSSRPVLLIGGGLSRQACRDLLPLIESMRIMISSSTSSSSARRLLRVSTS